MATHGRQSTGRNGGPTYDPRELLNPNRRAPNPAQLASGPASTSHSGTSTPEPSAYSPMVFQFSAPNGAQSEGPSSGAPSPHSNGAPAPTADPGMWVEKLHNVQARTEAPDAKRRRLEPEAEQIGTKIPVRNGSGILGQYVKDKRQESGGASTPQSMTVDLTDGNDDDDVVTIGSPRAEEVCYGLLKTSLNCSIVPSAKPGTKSIWGSGYHPFVKVVLKRQVGDKTNRIQAYDHTRQVIGQVEAASAVGLSPLIDSGISLRTECRLPSQPKKEGEEPGHPTSRTFNLDITMYGPMKYAKNVGAWLSKHNLKLLGPTLVQKGIRVHNPHVKEFQPPPPKTYPTASYGSYASSNTRTVEEIKSEIMGVFDSITRSEDLPLAEPDPCITTPLLKHQKQGLYFMQARETLRHTLPSENHHLTSLWKVKRTAAMEKQYYNVITQNTQKETPPETRGGILADMMGLGKTLSILSLVAGSLDASREWASRAALQPTAPETKASRHDINASQSSLSLTPLLFNVKTTLLICPLSTVTNWEEQIKCHIAPGGLNYHIYHGSNRIKDPVELAKFDMVITTYGSVSNELSSRNKGKDGQYPLEQLGWFRIVLDEAHMIREQTTLQFKSIIRLQAQRRWAVTGTPVQNRLEDLASLLAFVRLHPFEHRSKFTRYIVEPFKVADPEVVPRLRILVDTVTLRRLKDKIDLPPREDLVVRLKFTPEEQEVYDLFAKNAKDRVKALAGSNNGQALGGSTYIHILKSILRLRLLCAHGKDLLNEEDLASLQGMSAEMAIDIDDDEDEGRGPAMSHRKAHEMFSLMQNTNNDACIDCGRKISTGDGSNAESENNEDTLGYMTPCFHVICCSCIGYYKERARSAIRPGEQAGPCPSCQSHVRFEFVELKRSDVEVEHEGAPKASNKPSKKKFDNYAGPHSKTRALVEDLLRAQAQSEHEQLVPPIKSVVFSGWTSHLDLIEMALRAAKIGFTRLDGGMTRTARTAAMDRFREDDSVEVILVSIMAGGLGLNLTSGSNVYVMEPQYNPAAEAQAIDRVHRLGQKRPVRTIRYIMDDSFEEKMLELQEKKKKLASLSMDGQSKPLDKSEAARQKLADLRSLFK